MRINEVKKNRGITLIALVITIIVMLILVAVTISMVIDGGLFDKAEEAVGKTENAIKQEQQLINDIIDEYHGIIGGTGDLGEKEEPITGDNGETFTAIYKKTKLYTDKNKETAMIPKGYAVGTSEGIDTIETGLVIRDVKGNEFVWIPVTKDIEASYDVDENGAESGYYEPKELKGTWSNSTLETKPKYDSQEILNELYGENYYKYPQDFNYAEEYAQMVEKVNHYNGFYIGRYETTIDNDGNIGSKFDTPVLTGGTIMFTKDSTDYPYRWYGLYQEQKNADVSGNGTDVQTAMIYGVLWDKTMQFIRDQNTAGNTEYDVDNEKNNWHIGKSVVNSAQANPGTTGDVALNIWDLEGNAYDWTQEASANNRRVNRGGYYSYAGAIEASSRFGSNFPWSSADGHASRIVLYVL